MRCAAVAVLVVAVACYHPVSQPAPAPIVWLTPQLRMVDSAWNMARAVYHEGWLVREERSLCVGTAFSVQDSVITVRAFSRPFIIGSDSVTINYICPAGPVLHTHLVENGWRYTPSPTDTATVKRLSAPFHLLMSDDHAMQVFWKPPF